MAYPDSQQAIVAQLAEPRGRPFWQIRPSPGGWRSAISHGGGHDADPDTISFVETNWGRRAPFQEHPIKP
jgi:hypothetical protein